MSIALRSKAWDVNTRGFCVIEEAYDEDECARMRAILDMAMAKRQPPSKEAPLVQSHPLFEFAPELAPYFAKPSVVDAMAEVLQDHVRLAHNGGGIFSNAHAGEHFTSWHYHYGWERPEGGLDRDCPERILCNVYVDGSDESIGPLVVLPRGLNDPVEPQGEESEHWEGEELAVVLPGSAVIFDTCLWHCSRRGTSAMPRHLWGGHYQGWGHDRPHGEDNDAHQAAVVKFAEASPILRSLIDGP